MTNPIATINLGCNGVLFPMPLTKRQQLGLRELMTAGKAESLDEVTLVNESARVIQLPSIPRAKNAVPATTHDLEGDEPE